MLTAGSAPAVCRGDLSRVVISDQHRRRTRPNLERGVLPRLQACLSDDIINSRIRMPQFPTEFVHVCQCSDCVLCTHCFTHLLPFASAHWMVTTAMQLWPRFRTTSSLTSLMRCHVKSRRYEERRGRGVGNYSIEWDSVVLKMPSICCPFRCTVSCINALYFKDVCEMIWKMWIWSKK